MSNNSTVNSTNALPRFTEAFSAGTATFTIFLILGTIFGNALVVLAFWLHVRMRTVTNYFLVSLAWTDLCVALFSMPVWVAYLLTGPMWAFGAILPRVWTMVDILVGTASIMNLLAISFDRALSITIPLQYTAWMTPRKVTVIITFIWLYSAGMATASLLLFTKPIFNLVATVMCFCVPLLVIITAYSVTFKVAIRQRRQMYATTPGQYSRSQRNFMKDLKAAKTIAVVVGAFVICWVPFVTLNLIYSLCDPSKACRVEIRPEVIMVTKWMHYGNSLLNPIIYTVMNRDFRRAFKVLLCLTNQTLGSDIDARSDNAEANTVFQME